MEFTRIRPSIKKQDLGPDPTAKKKKDPYPISIKIFRISQDPDPQPCFILYCIAGSIIPPGDEFADVHERVKYFCGVTNEELLEKLRLGCVCVSETDPQDLRLRFILLYVRT